MHGERLTCIDGTADKYSRITSDTNLKHNEHVLVTILHLLDFWNVLDWI